MYLWRGRLMLVKVNKDIPLFGCIAFGIIDRGTNLIQVRATSRCNLKCIYCSVSAGDVRVHPNEFEVDLDYLVNEVRKVAEFKGEIEANIDSVGDPAMYPKLVELIDKISKIKQVKMISMQSNGTLLNKKKVDELAKAGLNRINLSLNSLDKKLASKLAGCPYNLDKVLEIAEHISKKMELLIAPLWLPGLNDEEIPKLIELAKKLKCKIGIQKYETHRYGRKAKGAKKITYWKFYNQLEKWEKEHNAKLKLGPIDFKIKKAKRIPIIFKKGDKVNVEIKLPGWMKGQMIGVAKGRCITVLDCDKKVGQLINVKILSNKDGIYMAK